MYIRKPRGISTTQIFIVTIIGVIGGVYIWRPLLHKYMHENNIKENKNNKNTLIVSSEKSAEK